jgi:hypothetical protein
MQQKLIRITCYGRSWTAWLEESIVNDYVDGANVMLSSPELGTGVKHVHEHGVCFGNRREERVVFVILKCIQS